MSDPSPDTPNAYAPRCGHHGNPLVWLDPALRWRCPHCFPELFPDARPATCHETVHSDKGLWQEILLEYVSLRESGANPIQTVSVFKDLIS